MVAKQSTRAIILNEQKKKNIEVDNVLLPPCKRKVYVYCRAERRARKSAASLWSAFRATQRGGGRRGQFKSRVIGTLSLSVVDECVSVPQGVLQKGRKRVDPRLVVICGTIMGRTSQDVDHGCFVVMWEFLMHEKPQMCVSVFFFGEVL